MMSCPARPTCALLTFLVIAISATSVRGAGKHDVRRIISEHPSYRTLEEDEVLGRRFRQYMKWLSDLEVPDARLVQGFIEEGRSSLDALSTIFHEKVEFAGWLELGHRFEDILKVEYYQAHYLEVYPIVHRKAMLEELSLVRHFALAVGSPPCPELALVLVNPLVEHHGAPVAMMARRLRHNPELLDQPLTPEDIERAIRTWESGGYAYREREKIREQAIDFIRRPR